MSDGGSWNPGSPDPRYDPFGPTPQPPRYGPPNQRQGRGQQGGQGGGQGGYGPGPQGQGYGPDYDPGYDQDYGQDRGGYGGAPRPPAPRGPRPQGRPQGADPRRSPYGPGPQDARSADAWSAPSSTPAADPWDEPEAPSRSRRRSGARGDSAADSAQQQPGHVNEDIDLDEVDPNGKAQRAWAKEQAAAASPKSKKTATKWTAIGVSLALLAGVGFVGYVYESTVGSIHHTALLPPGVSQTPLPPDPYGNRAENILLIGSDTRDDATDCKLGGDCSKTDSSANVGANADSQMILHISAERTNATVLSIPRDTIANLPNCSEKNGQTEVINNSFSNYQINNALQYGPECQVVADEHLTGITITDFIEFDFSGIVTMSDALGGVPVCVTKPVHDVFPSSGSGLTLPAGTSTVEGKQALQFLRTRDSFFDGSDLGREETTHYFLSQMIQTLRKNLNFSSLGTLINIGQAAAKSTTVSDGLAGLTKLEGFVTTLNKVPTDKITMLTTPTDQDPQSTAHVILDPSAQPLFAAIQNDTSFTAAKAPAKAATTKPATSAPPPPNVDKSQVPVNVYNADGVPGRAGAVASALESDGFTNTVAQGNANAVDSSLVYYDSSEATQQQAEAVASALGIPYSQVQSTTQFKGVSVFVGGDFQSGTKISAAGSSGAKPAVSAPPVANESFASGSANECIPVFSGNLKMGSK